jgi:ubiquinone/menaquinone biosynthesis C-methylase UbiE
MSTSTTAYYDATAARYDELHAGEKNLEHLRALERAWSILLRHDVRSVLDVGCGTGRALRWVHDQNASIKLSGIDPSQGLLSIAMQDLPTATLRIGTGEKLPFDNASVDVAIATGIMHHVDKPASVIAEMFRVARKAVLISDHNNFAFNSTIARRVRIALYSCGLFGIASFIKQGFRRQGYSEEDGWWYPYSLLNNHADIARFSDEMFYIPTRSVNSATLSNFLLNQSHLAVLALKRSELP